MGRIVHRGGPNPSGAESSGTLITLRLALAILESGDIMFIASQKVVDWLTNLVSIIYKKSPLGHSVLVVNIRGHAGSNIRVEL